MPQEVTGLPLASFWFAGDHGSSFSGDDADDDDDDLIIPSSSSCYIKKKYNADKSTLTQSTGGGDPC
jgi:hypothetical protein